eukprot:TRINITY_DN3827_c1_g1_i1.p1 TRINITY_DN3827_c1_g1~~TRINITY_DN3827_c1_g1_i1.p1  ORF type:complete len:236 (+),score=33.46 TRINITY_DN3827_c1_g1_i1:322-1029(+)
MVFTDGPLAYHHKTENYNNNFMEVSMHIDEFKLQLLDARELSPIFINSHSGKDWFSTSQAVEFFTAAVVIEKEVGIKVTHETHRSRILYSPWIMCNILPQVPELKLCADLSHFVVCSETHPLDPKLTEAVVAIADRVHHIHARVGFDQGPQITDPRAPEWSEYVRGHELWWEAIWKSQNSRELAFTSVTPEFGPAPYMHLLPYTQQPVSNLWDICNFMHQRLRSKFASLYSASDN